MANDLLELTAAIARELGPPWAASPLPENEACLHGPGRHLLVVRHDHRNDRLTIAGAAAAGLGPHWPRPSRHRINVSRGKSPERIAGEISRRLLPDYRAALAVAETNLEIATRTQADAARALAILARQLHGTVTGQRVYLNGPSSHLTGTVSLAEGALALNLRLPAPHAAHLAQALRNFRATP
jgi:hypothetical protein